jgi:hypothetical protein
LDKRKDNVRMAFIFFTVPIQDSGRAKEELNAFLRSQLKPSPCLNRTAHGMDFLGCRLYRRHLVLSRRSRRRFRRKLIRLERLFAADFTRISQMARSFRHGVCAFSLENPAFRRLLAETTEGTNG